MKISYNWLKQFIKIDWTAEKTSELLTDLAKSRMMQILDAQTVDPKSRSQVRVTGLTHPNLV